MEGTVVSKELPEYCPQCRNKWARRQSPWFRHCEYVYCESCKANAETILKRCEKNPDLNKKEDKPSYKSLHNDWHDYWRD